ncbi:pyridoxamine 5'-phosphate oxidase [Sulfitobacter sp. JB4-11]|uniref:pyridoxamine 5'-phosphate oxidase n=1 Tax=Sulfitobacter rhodophyticola TaxID=3238304 RepID=UPI003D814091
MAERAEAFSGDDPFVIAQQWLEEAAQSEPNDPNAAALATVDKDGMPNTRVVLIKEIEADAFVFYTNYTSPKAQEMDQAGKAAIGIHWKSLRRQIRARGLISREDGPQADAYYNSRPLNSRIGAWASRQSQPLGSREDLMDEVQRLTGELGERPARPDFWGGYRLVPLEMEFWSDGEARLHDRFRWCRQSAGTPWEVTRLNP